MSEPTRRVRVVLATLALAGACSVLAPRPDASRFFTLTPLGETPPTVAPLGGRTLGVGPITLPPYLERPEVMVRVGPNEVRPARFDYWAGGSLPRQIESILSQNLQALTGPDSVVPYPWYAGSRPDVSVEIDVREFERSSDGQVHLLARWRIRRKPSGQVVKSGETNRALAAAEDAGSAAAGLSVLLGELSREIAAEVAAVVAR